MSRKLALSLGVLLTVGLAVGSAGWIFLTEAWKVKEVSCQIQGQPCPTSLAESLSQMLNNKPIFFNQPSLEPDYQVLAHSAVLPGQLIIDIAPTTQVLGSTSAPQVITTPPELAIDQTKAFLEKEAIEYQNIVLTSDQQTVIVTLNSNLRALLITSELETNVQKLSLILKYLDLPTIDADIHEVDVRYRLPVLRTKLSDTD